MKSFCLGLAFCLVLTFGAALPARAISIVAPQSGSVVGDARIFVSGRAGVDTLRVGLNSKALPEVINTDELQTLFGGDTSFDWAVKEENGAVGPYPAFPVFGTAAENTDALEPGRQA